MHHFFLPQALLLSLTTSFFKAYRSLHESCLSWGLPSRRRVLFHHGWSQSKSNWLSVGSCSHRSWFCCQAVEWFKELIWLKMGLAKSKKLISLKWLVFYLLYYLLLAQIERWGNSLQRQKIWVIQQPAMCLRSVRHSVIPFLLLDRDFSRVMDREFLSEWW